MKRVIELKRVTMRHGWSSPHYGDVFCATGLLRRANVPNDVRVLDLVLCDEEPTEDTDYYRVRVGGSGIMVQAPDPGASWLMAATYYGIDNAVRDFSAPLCSDDRRVWDDWPTVYVWLEYDV